MAGANASANLYSLVETAKANCHEPYAYIKQVLTQLPTAKQQVAEAMDALSDVQRTELTERARAQLALDFPDQTDFLGGHVLAVERSMLEVELELPEFDVWLEQQAQGE